MPSAEDESVNIACLWASPGEERAMADADWHRYRQLRGKDLPHSAELLGASYHRRQVLKRDFYAAVGIYDRDGHRPDVPPCVLLKIYHTDRWAVLPLGWLGRFLCRREMLYYQLLDGIHGVPRLLGQYGEAGLVRQFIPGCNLREYRAHSTPDQSFFPSLSHILEQVHARGITHNDLSKPENVLVTEEGAPVLIDFQIALAAGTWRWPIVRLFGRQLMRYLQKIDRYHLGKLHRRARPEDFSADSLAEARTKGVLLQLHGWLLRRPYRIIRHQVMNRWMRTDETKRAA
jgi:serine/threonine protein kinase